MRVISRRKLREFWSKHGDAQTSLLLWYQRTTSLFLNGEPETARLILRDLMNITTELKKLADETGIKEIG